MARPVDSRSANTRPAFSRRPVPVRFLPAGQCPSGLLPAGQCPSGLLPAGQCPLGHAQPMASPRASLGHWPALGHARRMAGPRASLGRWPSQGYLRPRGCPKRPLVAYKNQGPSLGPGNPILSPETLSNSYFTRFAHLWPLTTTKTSILHLNPTNVERRRGKQRHHLCLPFLVHMFFLLLQVLGRTQGTFTAKGRLGLSRPTRSSRGETTWSGLGSNRLRLLNRCPKNGDNT